MPKWIKQLTRENTLLDRSLRTLAYHESVREIGRASISKSPIVGTGKVTSLYYSPADYKKQQKIIIREFAGKNVKRMGESITRFLEQANLWAVRNSGKKISKSAFLKYLDEFDYHHAHCRGAIVYGYWGEPVVTARLRTMLSRRIKANQLDHYLSILSSPKILSGTLTKIYYPSRAVEAEKRKLIKRLKLRSKELGLVEILSWFTMFYEVGERVASQLYDDLLKRLKNLAGDKAFQDLQWYDPESLRQYLAGRKLSKKELQARQHMYILLMEKGHVKVLSGSKAAVRFHREFKEKIPQQKNEAKGVVACKGNAVGRVRIVVTQDDQLKMKKGDILVSTMTTPRLIAAVKKAGAIVTDEGGMSAHAAIVAREFNIPCIVGTKIATKIFKDGDKVEVDANKGIVRRI